MPAIKLSDANALEQYRIALENAITTTAIAEALSELGYDEATINEGKGLLETARTAFDANKAEDDETTQAYQSFSSQKETIDTAYRLHRKKAKVVFRTDGVTAGTLAITGSLPQAYISWLETVKKFYNTANASDDIKTKLTRLKITDDDITEALAAITALETARAEYLREKGESQEATKTKDQAIAALSNWMSEFYAVARIALEDKPQLLEALGKVVRS